MPTTVRSSSVFTNAAASAVSIVPPAGTVSGDVSLVIVHCNGVTTIVDNNGATPWTEDLNDFPENTGGQTISVFSRRLTGAEAGNQLFTIGAADRVTAVSVAIQNPHATVIYDVAPIVGNSDVATGVQTINAKTITTLNANSLHFAICGTDGATNPVTVNPAGYTVPQSSGDEWLSVCYKLIAAAGVIAAQTFNYTSVNSSQSLSFAIRDIGSVANPTGFPDPSRTARVAFERRLARVTRGNP